MTLDQRIAVLESALSNIEQTLYIWCGVDDAGLMARAEKVDDIKRQTEIALTRIEIIQKQISILRAKK